MKNVTIAILFVLLTIHNSFADDFIWYGVSGNGIFGEQSNWNSNLVPSPVDRAVFPFMNHQYTVTLDQSYENKILFIDGADMVLNLNEQAYSLTCDPTEDISVYIGSTNSSNPISRLNVVHGNVYSKELVISPYDTNGILILSGSDVSWEALINESWYGAWIGEYGDANLLITNGAEFRHGHGLSAFDSESDTVIDVNGSGSNWYVDGQFDMSIDGKTTVTVENYGYVNIGKLTMGLNNGGQAEINIFNESGESMRLRSQSENSLTLGLNGLAAINVYGSEILNQGSMTIAENVGSLGVLKIYEGSSVNCQNSVAVGGDFVRAGGVGRIELVDNAPTNGIETELRVQAEGSEYIKVWPMGTIMLNGGHITVTNNSGQPNPVILQGGTIAGNGTIWGNVENYGGLVAPTTDYNGNRLSFAYNYTQDTAGVLKIALHESEHYPSIQVNNSDFGQVNLDGILDVDLVDGYVPGYDDEFTIIIAHNITGSFINAASQYVFEGGSFEIIYNADSVKLTHYTTQPFCSKYPMADVNKDCKVNFIDFAIFAEEWLDCNLYPDSYCSSVSIVN